MIMNIPHWLLDKLNAKEREHAEKLLFDENWKIGDVAKIFGIKHPSSHTNKPAVFWDKKDMVKFFRDFYELNNKIPSIKDINKLKKEGVLIPSPSTFIRNLGSWNNGLRLAGIPLRPEYERISANERIKIFGKVPSNQEVIKEKEIRHQHKRSSTEGFIAYQIKYRKKNKIKTMEYMQIYNQKPEVKKKRRLYLQIPEVIERRRAYYQTPEYKKMKKEYYKQRMEKIKMAQELEQTELEEKVII